MAEILSKRGCQKFFHDGHLFTFDKNSADGPIKFRRCDKRAVDGCKARLHTNVTTNEVLRLINSIIIPEAYQVYEFAPGQHEDFLVIDS